LAHDRFTSASSAITVLCQVAYGHPRFLFPGGVHRSATLGILSCPIISKDVAKPSQALTLDLKKKAPAACLLIELRFGYFIRPEYLADLP